MIHSSERQKKLTTTRNYVTFTAPNCTPKQPHPHQINKIIYSPLRMITALSILIVRMQTAIIAIDHNNLFFIISKADVLFICLNAIVWKEDYFQESAIKYAD